MATEPVPTPASAPVAPAPAPAAKPAAPPTLATKPAATAKLQPIPGWWKLAGIKGTRGGVIKAVQAAEAIPAHWKAALMAEIGAHPSAAMTVNAHFSQENRKVNVPGQVPTTTKGRIILHMDISPMDLELD